MGYYENCCQICAVSFNIARLRLAHESQKDGWGYSGPDYYMGEPNCSSCVYFTEVTGCENVHVEEEGGLNGSGVIHYPGRGCTSDAGYNGNKIGAIEMNGMNLPRYIVRKPKDADPDPEAEDEEEYESASEFFLTPQTTCPPDHFEPGNLPYFRFDVEYFHGQNHLVSDENEQPIGVPVHAACWKIFERVSSMRLGKVDLQGFMALWYRQACSQCGFQSLRQDPAIRECKAQFWNHIQGTEYLGANPYDIPAFPLSLLHEYCSTYPQGEGAFEHRSNNNRLANTDEPRPANNTDIFCKLSTELLYMVLSHLSSKEIGSLRLTTRSCRQLPKSCFQRLIKAELPWFWEFDQLRELGVAYQKKTSPAQEGYHNEKINWLKIYKRLRSLESSVLGLRNRVRVWGVAEEIVERISDLRQRHVDGLESVPTDEEREAGLVKHDFYCPKCVP